MSIEPVEYECPGRGTNFEVLIGEGRSEEAVAYFCPEEDCGATIPVTHPVGAAIFLRRIVPA